MTTMRPYHEHDMSQTRRVCLRNWASLSMNLYVCILITKKHSTLQITRCCMRGLNTLRCLSFYSQVHNKPYYNTPFTFSPHHMLYLHQTVGWETLLKTLCQTGHDKYVTTQLAREYSRIFVSRFSFFFYIVVLFLGIDLT